MRRLFSITLLVFLAVACAPAGAPGASAPAAQPTATRPAATSAPATSAPTAVSPEALHVKYAYAPRLPMIPVFVAQEKGFFAEQGLDVEFVTFLAGSNEMLPPLSQGQLDVAAAGISAGMVNAAADGIIFRIVADQGQIANGRSVYNIAVRSDVASKFTEISDLRGSTGGVPAIDSGLSLPYTFYKVAQAAGLTTPDGLSLANFTFVETPAGGVADQLAMFQNKVQEWQLLVEPVPALMEDRGLGVRWKRTDEIVRDPIQAYTLLYGERFMRDKPEAARRFMVAYVQGLRYFLDHVGSREITAIAAKHAQVSEDVVERSLWAYYDPNGRVDIRSLQDQHDFWQAKGLIRKGIGDVRAIIDYSYLDAALAQLGTR
ncbi:MAG: ABC transporter substrate-binding protein [Chloroflexi bacterium]|nr:ABC transporter substrate-binding protein [Chloroflexota bacterium]